MGDEEARSGSELLVFELAGHRYGVTTRDVVELLRAVAVVPVPKAPGIVVGVMNLRGAVVPVVDLAARFGLPRRPIEVSDHFVVARAKGRLVGLKTDRVLGIAMIAAEDVEPTARTVGATAYTPGIAKLPDGLVLIHDLAALLSDAEAATLDGALDEAALASGAP